MSNLFILPGFILGTILGSLAKVLADRSLRNRSFFGRSYCPNCKQNLRWFDLFPILSYILLLGKCRYCHKKISIEYVMVEVVMGVLIAFLFSQTFSDLRFMIYDLRFSTQSIQAIFDLIFKAFFVTVLAVVTITDLKKTLIPDRIIIPSIWFGLIALLVFTVYRIGYLYFYLDQTPIGKLLLPPHSDYFARHAYYSVEPLLGGILTGVGIASFFMLLIIVTKGRGMGGGDVKLGGFMGLMLGFPNAVLAVILAFLTGATVALVLIGLGKKRFGENIPFGPFLVLGSLIALFWGTEIVNWYLSLSG